MTASNTATAGPTAQEVVITRVLAAPRDLVFKAWLDREQVVRWWGPKGFTIPFCELDPRPGGAFHYCMRSAEGRDYWVRGTYREIVEPERIVFTDGMVDETGKAVHPSHYGMSEAWPMEVRTSIDFTEADGRTTITLRMNVARAVAERDGVVEGWNESFDRLAEHLARSRS
jgi:uncharacterized protein YndB with AHSA1/START domain